MAVTRTETARINHRHDRVRRVTRLHRRTTIVEAAARTKLRLTPHQAAVTRRQRALIPRHPTQHLRVLTLLPAGAMGAAEARVTARVVEVARTVEEGAADRMEAVLMEAVLTDANFSQEGPLRTERAFFVFRSYVKRNVMRTTLRVGRCLA